MDRKTSRDAKMLASELEHSHYMQTQAETPATSKRLNQSNSPLRRKTSHQSLTSFLSTASRGVRHPLPAPSASRYSYALGDGKFLLLEEVASAAEPTTPIRPSHNYSKLIQA